MDLIKVARCECLASTAPLACCLIAWLEFLTDGEMRAAVLAANVNIIRRMFPFAFLLAEDLDPELFAGQDLGWDPEYLGSLERALVRKAESSDVLVVAIRHLDVLPFVLLLENENCRLLCVDRPVSLAEVSLAVSASQNDEELAARFGACSAAVVSIVDGIRFCVVTQAQEVERYFRISNSAAG